MLATTTILRQASRVLSRSPLATNAHVAGMNNIQVQRRNYHENIVEHYENPRNVGSLDKNSDDVGTVSDSVVYYCNNICCVFGIYVFIQHGLPSILLFSLIFLQLQFIFKPPSFSLFENNRLGTCWSACLW